nr:MAG TPA: hypothetical protein [Caudoviricetes sp.]
MKTVLLDTAILYSLHLIVVSMFGRAGKRGTLEPHQNQLETHGHTVWHFIKPEVSLLFLWTLMLLTAVLFT